MKKCFSWKWLISWIIFQLLQYFHTVPNMNYSLYTYCYSFHSKYKLFILYIKQFCGLNEVFSKFGGIWIFGLILVETLGLVLETFSWWSKFITLVGLLTFQNHMVFLVYFLSASSLWFGDASYKLHLPHHPLAQFPTMMVLLSSYLTGILSPNTPFSLEIALFMLFYQNNGKVINTTSMSSSKL